MSVQQEKFKEIADAIRAKTGETDLIKPSDFAGKVGDVYEAGKKAYWDEVWKGIQNGGNRVYYNRGFFGTKNLDKWFYPKYNIKPTSSDEMFRGATSSTLFSLADRLDECGVTLDTSKCPTCTNMFAYCTNLAELPVISFEAMTDTYYTTGMFIGCRQLKTIRGIIPAPATANNRIRYWDMFTDCIALENLTIMGTLYHGLSVSPCIALTHDSLMSIINNLADYSEDTSGKSWVVTLGTTNLRKLTDVEKAIATEKGWTLA